MKKGRPKASRRLASYFEIASSKKRKTYKGQAGNKKLKETSASASESESEDESEIEHLDDSELLI